MSRAIQRFEVSLKAFILRERQALFVREADTGYWELPGGRIDVGEETEPHRAILARELKEELGADFHVDPSLHVITWTRRRPLDGAFLFIVARTCRHRAGEPRLSHEHDDYAWVGPEAWRDLNLPPDSAYPEGIAELFRAAAMLSP